MTERADPARDPAQVWVDALVAAHLFAVEPFALGGIVVRARVGPVLQAWLAHLHRVVEPRPVRRMPAHVSEDRLIGGLDLAATLQHGRLVAERGLLAEADDGVVVVPMAERIAGAATGALCMALDRGEVALERDGLTGRMATRVGVVLLDEGIGDERVPAALADRAALHLDLGSLRHADLAGGLEDGRGLAEAWREVGMDPAVAEAICATALALGVYSMRASVFALTAARLSAAWHGRATVEEADVTLAARLVLGPRATQLPGPPEDPEAEPPPPPPPEDPPPDSAEPDEGALTGPLEDMILAAAASAMPEGLLAQLALARQARSADRTAGSAGALVQGNRRGRPAGTRRGHPRTGGRLNVVETLRAAAPWQRVRAHKGGARVEVRQDDFRVTRYKRRTETLTVFAVDASGSAALQRLAEAKGAVETVLSECYVRRDHVALIAFRGDKAELLLPPTRSLVRAKRCLAGMPGGGTTPLAAGVDAARALAEDARRRGQSPIVIVMTDGRANIARDGAADRARAGTEALAAAKVIQAAGIPALFVDTAPRPRTEGRALAEAMGAQYLHLPYAEDRAIAGWVGQVGAGGRQP